MQRLRSATGASQLHEVDAPPRPATGGANQPPIMRNITANLPGGERGRPPPLGCAVEQRPGLSAVQAATTQYALPGVPATTSGRRSRRGALPPL
eukprot:CAMPEP_0206139308 /NCGR_PEP_ID=MMETSP1473-20131121/5524_1 /ASSEMBLY_ACC=CAM_ASM_001109 /TAXON_ID=1461547 /ORGANISM="Stichococcus sp, Strain RCC1054" /LENGTH=93 /DNA_ID=CAMNT_0053533049 /DNA_START=258 /DNA_END=539 /DNA_ORIENTATION=-